jgi:hypothetical protein
MKEASYIVMNCHPNIYPFSTAHIYTFSNLKSNFLKVGGDGSRWIKIVSRPQSPSNTLTGGKCKREMKEKWMKRWMKSEWKVMKGNEKWMKGQRKVNETAVISEMKSAMKVNGKCDGKCNEKWNE